MTEPHRAFLPIDRAGMEARGWGELDILLVTGDAYVDHPAFGAALLGRWLEAHGWRVGLVAQPRWQDPADVARLGRPRLFVGVTAGALDSMLAHYTAFRKKRSEDACTPGGRAGARPNRACLVYAGLARQAFPGLPIVLGGIEASLRRAVHFDFWSDRLRKPILLDAKADLCVCGMAERPILEIADRLAAGRPLDGIPGTCRIGPPPDDALRLPSLEEIEAAPPRLVAAAIALERQSNTPGARSWQEAGGRTVVFEPPAEPLTTEELDRVHALPFLRRAHPSYAEAIPAEAMIRDSVQSHRGCGGGCSFCSLALHQGRRIASRSAGSLRAEVAALTAAKGWKGSVSDVGGPTANLWGAACRRTGPCVRSSCLHPEICPLLDADADAWIGMLRSLAALPGVRHLRVASGIRHDLLLSSPEAARALVAEFAGGQLKLAPEHCAPAVLALMRKPGFAAFERFLDLFAEAREGRELYVIPYLMSAFPGCTDEDMRRLADWLARRGWKPQQVQCFIPTPGTVASAMYWSGTDEEGRRIPVARSDAERLRQHGILTGTVGERRRLEEGRRKRRDRPSGQGPG